MNLPRGLNVYIVAGSIIFFAVLHIVRTGARGRDRIAEIFLRYAVGIGGFNGITSFFVHTVWADSVAEAIGWAAGSPFQTEVGVANLAIGIIGAASFWREDFVAPAVIAGSIFSAGAGVTHVVDIVQHGNFAPGNAGPILYWDFIRPAVLVPLLVIYERGKRAGLLPQWPVPTTH